MKALLISGMFVVASAGCFAAQAAPAKPKDDITLVTPLTLPGAETFIYHDVKPEPMRIHVFKPEGWKPTDRRPAFVFFFGGGWLRGTPSTTTGWMQDAVKMGMVAIAPDYRVKERHHTDADKSVADARAAYHWVLEHAAEFGIDPDRVVLSGSSAGGHVALWAALSKTPWGSDPAEAPAKRPAAIVLMSAVSDTSEATGVFPERMVGHAAELSPMQNLDPKMPPTLILHGDADNVVPYRQAVALDQKLKETGNVSELITMPGVKHGYQQSGWRAKAPGIVEEFLRKQGILPAVKP